MNAKEQFLDHLLRGKTKGTYKSYKRGLELFLEWYGKDADTVLTERKADIMSDDFKRRKNFDYQVEYFYKWELEKDYALSSARTNTLGIIQFFRYFGMPITPNIPMPPPTTKTAIPKIEDIRRMFQVASIRGKVILSLGLDLAWRISDFIDIKIDDLPDLNQKPPIPFQRITKKENIISSTFISTETVELLRAYLPTLTKKDNPYLFAGNGKHHLKDESVNKILKKLAKKANVKIPKGKRLTFHSLRKRFLSTAYSLRIDPEHAKLMTGKSIGSSIDTYIQDANLRDAFIELREEALSLSNGTIKSTMQTKDQEIIKLKQELADSRRLFNGLLTLLGEELKQKAIEAMKKHDLPTTEEDGKELTMNKMLFTIAKLEEDEQKAEYTKLLKETNGFNGKPKKEKVEFT